MSRLAGRLRRPAVVAGAVLAGLSALAVVAPRDPGPRPDPLIGSLASIDERSREAEPVLARTIDEVRRAILRRPADAGPSEDARRWFADRLSERSPFYRGRGEGAAERIRARILLLAAESGCRESLWPRVAEALVFATAPVHRAAAIRAARECGFVGEALVERLRRELSAESYDDSVALDPSTPEEAGGATPAARTTVRREALLALDTLPRDRRDQLGDFGAGAARAQAPARSTGEPSRLSTAATGGPKSSSPERRP